jgi:hypothetical protein
MRWRPFLLGLALGWFGLSSPARAILLVETTPGSVPVGGYLVSEDGKKLKIKTLVEGGREKFTEYELSKIKIIHRVDNSRLEKLNKDDPKGYFEYATELADRKLAADPEARDLARRLFLIAAYLDKRQFGNEALLNMGSLASTPGEARRCRALASLFDTRDGAKPLKPEPLSKVPTGALQDFQKALQLYRTGDIANARKRANQKDMDLVFSMAPGKMDKATFLQWCIDADGPSGSQSLSEDRLRMVLQAELWVLEQLSRGDTGDKTSAGETKWSSILQSRQVGSVPVLSLETVSEFDPRKCLYREGKWVVP